MALPQAVYDVLNSLQIVGLPSRVNAGDRLTPQLSPGLDAFDALAAAPTLANLDLALNLDPSNLRFAGLTTEDELGDAVFELVLKAVEFPKPAEKHAQDISTTAPANNELPYLAPKPSSGVPPYTLEISSSVEGLLGKVTGLVKQAQKVTGNLTGTLEGAIRAARTLVEEPTVEVEWRIEGKHALVDGTTLTNPVVPPTFVILPEFAELTRGIELTTSLRVFCQVSVTAQAPPSGPGAPSPAETIDRTIGPVEIQVPKVQLPTVLVMTEHAVGASNFPGAVLVAVPGTSAIDGLDQVSAPLRAVQTVLQNLGNIASIAFGDAAPIINMLIDRLTDANVRFIKQDKVMELSAVTLDPGGFLGWGYRSWEDVISAILLVGPPGRAITCHNRRNLWVGTGAFRVSVGQTGAARINNLNVDPNTITPDPTGSTFNIITPPDTNTYNDIMSSFQFVPL